MVAFLQQENMHLSLILMQQGKQQEDRQLARKVDQKGKSPIHVEKLKEKDVKVQPRRPETR